MFFPFVKHTGFDFAFPAVAKLRSHRPFVMIQQLTFGGETDDVVLAKFIQFQKHLIVIVSSVHDKSCFTKKSSPLFYGAEGNCVCRFIVFLPRRMDVGENADGMIAGRKDTSFRNMVALFINTFCGSAFRTIPDNTQSFEFITVRFYNVAVIHKDHRLSRHHLFYLLEIGSSRKCRGSFIKVSG